MKKPFLQIAEEYGLTMPTVKRIFMDYVATEEAKRVLYSPKVIGIDEAHLNKTMRGVIIDIKTAETEIGCLIQRTSDHPVGCREN